MRGRSSKKHESNEGMELEELPGAYIRGLVKQLTPSSTRTTKDLMNPKDQGCVVDDVSRVRNLTKHDRVVDSGQTHQPSTQPQQQHKKQVRRRLHTTRPYQERLLNMAEARKEIVTALKFHRASMKQASERQQQQQQQQQQQEAQEQQQQITSVSLQSSHQQPSFEQDGRFKSRRNPRTYPSCTTNFPNYMDDFSCSYLPQPPNSYTWPAASSIAPTPPPPPLLAENPNFILPNQTLGLNLNLHDFSNLDATFHLNNSSLSSYSSPTSSSPPLSVVTDQDVPSVGMSQGEGSSSLVDTTQSSAATWPSGDLHATVDDEGLAEIRSLGEQYQIQWNDTMNLVKSACWFKFLKSMEYEAPEEAKTEDDAYHIFDEIVEFPAWLNANGSCLEQCSEDYFQDSTLPCMDIGDIESMDEDWLA